MRFTLQQVSQHLRNKANTQCVCSVYVVVLCSTFPVFRPVHKTFVTELSITDNTVNNGLVKLKAFPVSSMLKEVLVSSVGEVVLLNNFVFTQRGDYYIEGKPAKDSSMVRMGGGWLGGGKDLKESNFEELGKWFIQNFPEVYRPEVGLDRWLVSEKSLVFNYFDLILRVVSVQKEATQTVSSTPTNLYTLTDAQSNTFYLQFPTQFLPSTHILVTRIKLIQNSFNIFLSQLSNVLQLPLPFNPKPYKCICSDDSNYNFVTHLTTIRSALFVEQESTTYLRELINEMRDFSKGNRMIQSNDHFYTMDRVFSQKQHILKVYPISITCEIKLFNGEFLVDEEALDKEHSEYNKHRYVWNAAHKYVYVVRFMMKDPSLEYNNDIVPVYLFNWDGNGDRFFPEVSLKKLTEQLEKRKNLDYVSIQEDNKHQLLEKRKVKDEMGEEDILYIKREKEMVLGKVDEWIQKIFRNTGSDRLMTLIVEPMKTKYELKYRIINTWLNSFD